MEFLTIDRDNAHLVADLIYCVFGYTYTDPWMYEAKEIADACAKGKHFFFAAVGHDGRAMAMLALRFPFGNGRVGELGTLISDPALRGAESGIAIRGLIAQLTRTSQALAENELRLLTSTEVVVHPLSQKLVLQMGFANVGLYLGWTPTWAEREREHQQAGSRRREKDHRRRSEVVSAYPFSLMLEPYESSPPSCLLPMIQALRDQYPRLPLSWAPSLPLPEAGSMEQRLEPLRSRALLRILEPGKDLLPQLLAATEHYRDGLVDIIHLQIPMRRTDLDPLLEPLLAAGYRFAAWLPAFFADGDLLVLQYLNGEIAPVQERQIASPKGRKLLKELLDETGPPQSGRH